MKLLLEIEIILSKDSKNKLGMILLPDLFRMKGEGNYEDWNI